MLSDIREILTKSANDLCHDDVHLVCVGDLIVGTNAPRVKGWLAAEFDGSVKFASVPLSGGARLVLAGACAGMKRLCMQRGSVGKALALLCLCVGKEVITFLNL
jgi:hypothetical protein